jgi:hypothetical protein
MANRLDSGINRELVCKDPVDSRLRIGIHRQPISLFSSIAGYRFGGYFGLDGDLQARARNAAERSASFGINATSD